MPEEIDELFGECTGQPEPRIGLVGALLVGGLVAATAGLACSSAPGGILVLVAWMVVEKELDRVESGYLPAEVLPRLKTLQRLVYAAVLVVIGLFVIQGLLFCNGVYDPLWEGVIVRVVQALT